MALNTEVRRAIPAKSFSALRQPLLLEQLDQRALLGLRRLGVRLDRVAHVDRVVEQIEDLLVGDAAPPLPTMSAKEVLLADLELTGVTVDSSPMELLRERLRGYPVVPASDAYAARSQR